MKPHTLSVLRALADGEFHSGVRLAQRAGVTRATVWNTISELEALGLEVARVHGRGYRLSRPLSLLDADLIARMVADCAPRLAIEVLGEVGSTNAVVLERAAAGAPAGLVVAAEWQSAGRGRRGRSWHASLGGGLTWSLLWRYERGGAALSGLSLAVGVALVRGLLAHGGVRAGLKWPNDLLAGGGKLGGILIEIAGDALGPGAAVIGVGLNVRLPAFLRRTIGQPATDLETMAGAALDRSTLLAGLLVELDRALLQFAAEGFAPFRREWQQCHAHHGQPVEVTMSDGRIERGIAQGVADDGSLLLETPAGVRNFHSGEVSLRPGRA